MLLSLLRVLSLTRKINLISTILLLSSVERRPTVAFATQQKQSSNNKIVSQQQPTIQNTLTSNYLSSSSSSSSSDTATSSNSFIDNTCAAAETTTTTTITMSCPTKASSTKLRTVQKILSRPQAHWVGDGFRVYPVFANHAFTEALSPLLMFDYAEPKQFPSRPGQKPYGVGQHPHRGFETVTVAFQGEVEHHDSTGKSGIIKEGDVQWMTAGRGIIHQEYHSKNFTSTGGTFEMCQLWVNLPKKFKMAKPGYQAITKESIPTVPLPLGIESDEETVGTARIIAGELGTTKGAAKTFSPIQMWDVTVPKSGTVIELPFPVDQNLIVFVRRGTIEIITDDDNNNKRQQSNYKLSPQDVAVMKLDGVSDSLRFRTYEKNTSVLVLGGEPLNEPIAARGPFVMNTDAEINQAMIDYQNGKMGR